MSGEALVSKPSWKPLQRSATHFWSQCEESSARILLMRKGVDALSVRKPVVGSFSVPACSHFSVRLVLVCVVGSFLLRA